MGYSDPPSLFARGGSLLPSIYADALYIDAVVVCLFVSQDREGGVAPRLHHLDTVHDMASVLPVGFEGGGSRHVRLKVSTRYALHCQRLSQPSRKENGKNVVCGVLSRAQQHNKPTHTSKFFERRLYNTQHNARNVPMVYLG